MNEEYISLKRIINMELDKLNLKPYACSKRYHSKTKYALKKYYKVCLSIFEVIMLLFFVPLMFLTTVFIPNVIIFIIGKLQVEIEQKYNQETLSIE